jgi:hypothetical protein
LCRSKRRVLKTRYYYFILGHGRGRDRTCSINGYHHISCEFESCSWRDVLDTTLCDEVCQVLRFCPKNQQSWQTGSRNLMGPKTVTEKNATKNILDGRTDRGKTVYPPCDEVCQVLRFCPQ